MFGNGVLVVKQIMYSPDFGVFFLRIVPVAMFGEYPK